jgi:hypothetical protein
MVRTTLFGLAVAASIVTGCGPDEGATQEQAQQETSETGVVSAAASTCGAGYVCIYQGDIWDGGTNHPMVARYYNYGTYNLSNMIGSYTIRNCQTGGAGVAAYSGYNATGSLLWDLRINNCTTGMWTNFTPVYSLRLHP